MLEATVFLTGIVLTALTGLVAAFYINDPLSSILRDICGTEERARFWTSFTNVLLVATPLILAMSYHPDGVDIPLVLILVVSQLQLGLIGLAVTITAAAIVINNYIPSQKEKGGKVKAPLPENSL